MTVDDNQVDGSKIQPVVVQYEDENYSHAMLIPLSEHVKR